MKADDGAGRSLYRRIYEDLEQKINTGEIRYMERLPVLPDLCEIYGVSDAPVRRALDDLARAGLVVKRRGRGQGTFAIKRLSHITVRVLLLADFDVYRSAIETCHEVFDLLDGIREAARDVGSRVQQVSCTSIDSLPPADVDTGYLVIAMSTRDYEEGVRLAARDRAPCVLVNPPHRGPTCVRVDIEQGARLGVNYLAQLGHRRIGYVGSTRSEWMAPRFAGYRLALEANGLALDPDLVRETDGVDPKQDEEALNSLLALQRLPTCLFAASDYRAIRLLSHCRRRGIIVPQRMSICGYDNIDEAVSVEPALTTVHHPRRELGATALELLRAQLRGEAPAAGVDHVVAPQLIVRGSSGPPAR
jgi:DNA-binding LacI/PurR family transcriptional regulator